MKKYYLVFISAFLIGCGPESVSKPSTFKTTSKTEFRHFEMSKDAADLIRNQNRRIDLLQTSLGLQQQITQSLQRDMATLRVKPASKQTMSFVESTRKCVITPTCDFVAAPTPVGPAPAGIEVSMSDGTTQVYPLGIWLEFQNNTIRAIEPTQYVNQVATVQNGVPGTGAVVTGTATSNTTLAFTIPNGGSGYNFPMITITGGTGSPGLATGTIVSGVLTAISAPSANGYTVGDVLTVSIVDSSLQTWLYTRAGRNVQVWRNGLLQRLGLDYTLNQTTMTITPIPVTSQDGTIVWPSWNATDLVTTAYLY